MASRGIFGAGIGVALLLAAGIATSASAKMIDNNCQSVTECDFLIDDGSPSGAPAPNNACNCYADVDVKANGGNLTLTLTFADGFRFANTGAGPFLGFNLVNDPSISLVGTLPTGFSLDQSPDQHFDGSGNWMYSINCDAATCGNGGSGGGPVSLTFTITATGGLSIADLIDSYQKCGHGAHCDSGFLFVTDICAVSRDGSCSFTGDVVSDGNTQQNVPEPLTLSLFGVGLVAMGALGRRRKKNTSAA